MGDILKYGLFAVGGYLLYNAFTSSTTAAAAPAAGAPAPAPAPAPSPAPSAAAASTVAALKTWAASQPGYNGTFSSDIWHWAWTTVLKKAPIPDADFFALFPGGTPPMTADAFVAAAQSHGLSGCGLRGLGLGLPRNISAPAAIAVAVERAKHLRRAGVQNYQLAGTPMPRGIR